MQGLLCHSYLILVALGMREITFEKAKFEKVVRSQNCEGHSKGTPPDLKGKKTFYTLCSGFYTGHSGFTH